jgi:hypothetical protein
VRYKYGLPAPEFVDVLRLQMLSGAAEGRLQSYAPQPLLKL